MNVIVQLLLLVSVLSLSWTSIAATSPISRLQVTLKGKKYDIHDVTTVSELQERLQEASGIPPAQQGRILFQGKRLAASTPTATLSDAGVKEGDQLNCVPGSTKKKSSTSPATPATTASTSTAASVSSSPDSSAIKEMLQNAGVDTNAMEEMVNQMMGGGGGFGDSSSASPQQPPSLQESMELMSSMMKSPIFSEYMNDPERLEESRQMILNNPMLKSMMASMPGMEELLQDPEAWRQAMQAAAQMYSQMDQDDLLKAMTEGADAAIGNNNSGIGSGNGFFDNLNANAAASASALDELSEGDD